MVLRPASKYSVGSRWLSSLARSMIWITASSPIATATSRSRTRTSLVRGAMAFKLIEAAEARWRAVNAPHLVALVRAGAVFEKGKLIERPVDSSTTKEAA
jgi:putative transposase